MPSLINVHSSFFQDLRVTDQSQQLQSRGQPGAWKDSHTLWWPALGKAELWPHTLADNSQRPLSDPLLLPKRSLSNVTLPA